MKTITTPQLGIGDALNAFTSKIFRFDGRARRSEFWWIMAFTYVVSIVLPPFGWIVDLGTIPLTVRRLHDIGRSGWWYAFSFILKFLLFINLIYDIIMFAINSNTVKGYEDGILAAVVTKYLVWVGIIIIYQLILLVFYCTDSERGENKYGESPKYKLVEE